MVCGFNSSRSFFWLLFFFRPLNFLFFLYESSVLHLSSQFIEEILWSICSQFTLIKLSHESLKLSSSLRLLSLCFSSESLIVIDWATKSLRGSKSFQKSHITCFKTFDSLEALIYKSDIVFKTFVKTLILQLMM